MDVPNSITAQVSRDGKPTVALMNTTDQNTEADYRARNKKGFFSSICCCFAPKRKELREETAGPTKIPVNVEDPSFSPVPDESLLGPQPARVVGRKTLVLDLDETLVHSSFKPIPNPDFVVPIEIEDQVHKIYVAKRPHVETFLMAVGEKYEVVVFTAGVSKYAHAVLDLLDPQNICTGRLCREHCTVYRGNYVKDLNRLGRDIRHCIIVDNSPASYLFHTDNAVPVESWFDDENDRELLTLIPFFDQLANAEDVKTALDDAKRNGVISH